MRRKEPLPELLSPAGDFECLLAAVEGGADAVYVGGKRFGARAFAKNFDIAELSDAVAYCHLFGVKLYVTVNTLVEEKELPELLEYAAELYRIGVDALIIADLGAISLIKKHIPALTLHASTQMSVHSTRGARAAREAGAVRVVVARELSLPHIKSITDNSDTEVEVFIHGALCVCHSGQCLFSSLVGGRSGNRGECAQPCRLPFNGKYPLSLKDLSLASHIEELIDSGVSSLKIEGRMKSPSYVYTVTSIYRALLDERRSATPEELETLRRVFSRGGFTDGYFVGRHTLPMTGVRSEEDKLDSRSGEERTFVKKRLPVKAEVTLRLGKESSMTLRAKSREVTVFGAIPTTALSSPLTEDGVSERLSKMGNTNLSLSMEDISLTLDEGINLPPSALNALRRAAAEAFESTRRELDSPRLEYLKSQDAERLKTVEVFSTENLERALAADKNAFSDFDIIFRPLFGVNSIAANGITLPPIIFDSEEETVISEMKKARELGIEYALVQNIGQISLARELGFIPIGGFRLNATSSMAVTAYRELGARHIILSPELTLPKARGIGGAVITYGRIPLMITERCFIKESFGCKSCGTSALTDRRGEKFPMIREFPHRNIILNSVPTYIGDRRSELLANRIGSTHLMFTTETPDEMLSVIKAHSMGAPLGSLRVRRVGRRDSKQK